MTLVLGIRHGAVENPRGLVYGRLPGFPLSAQGRAGAQELARIMATGPVRAVHASPLERAVQTAEVLAEPHGLEVRVDPRLVEWVGRDTWQGLVWTELVETAEYVSLGDDPVGLAPHDPLDRVGERVLAWARDAAAAHPDGMVVGVSHESPLVAAMLVGQGRPLAGYRAHHVPHLSGVRLLPGPPEPVDPVQALGAC